MSDDALIISRDLPTRLAPADALYDAEWGTGCWCSAEVPWQTPDNPDDHAPNCPWAEARRLLEGIALARGGAQ